jgi:hypothetical protein
MICSEDHWARSLRGAVALRRAVTGERFATCGRMAPVFAGLDNRWPGPETAVSPLAARDVPETIVSRSIAPATAEIAVSPWIAAGVSRATWFRRRKDETGVSRMPAGKPWIAAGTSRASWYRRGKSQKGALT